MSRYEAYPLRDDGLVPNNPSLPLRLYRAALLGLVADAVIARLATHGWGGAWINGIYPFQHYHARAHEVLVIVGGSARVQFGGPSGPVFEVGAGDAVLIPAGVGHCRLSASAGLVVVGAYPAGQEDYDLKRATTAERLVALGEIPRVALPARDPVTGEVFPGCNGEATVA